MPTTPLLLVVAIPLLAAALAPLIARLAPRHAGWLLALAPAATCGLVLHRLPLDRPAIEAVAWSDAMDVALRLRLDGLSGVMALLVGGIGALVVVYGAAYMTGKPGRTRLLSLLLVFCGAMMGLVLADDAILLFVCWEATSVCSYLLVGFDHRGRAGRAAARRALLITAFGGLALLGGLLLLCDAARAAGAGADARSLASWAALELSRGGAWRVELGSALVLLGALTKSAQLPWHFWLPGAMSAPTPVSAYLHSATMVKAGVYLLARLQPALGGRPSWVVPLALIGALTMLVGAWLALRQRDLKRILAYSTVSVLGALVLLIGLGTEPAIEAAVVFLVAHALYKAALFMVAGNVDLACRTRDVTRVGQLARLMPMTAAAGVVAALSKAGAPPLFGFIGKELLYKAKLDGESAAAWLIVGAVAANAMLVATALLVGVAPFFGRRPDAPPRQPAPAPHIGLWLAPLVLASAGLFVGLMPGAFDQHLGAPMASAIAGRPLAMKLTLWHGVSTEALVVLALSGLTLALGLALYRGLRRPLPWLGAEPAPERLAPWFDRAHDALIASGGWITARWQHGDLSGYLRVTLACFAALALAGALAGTAPRPPEAFAPLIEGTSLVLGGAGALVAALAHSRLTALCGLALVGLAVTLSFAAAGAVDVAVTLLLVETLALVVLGLILVGRRAAAPPDARPARPTPLAPTRLADATLALAAGAAVTSLTWHARAAHHAGETRDALLAAAARDAGGRNVVNTILVDFRGLDTLGELAVLALAGLLAGGLLLPRLRPIRGALTGDDPTLRMACRPLTLLLVVASIASLLRGHDAPGGGFIGGLLVGAALTLDLIAFGAPATRRLLRAQPRTLVAAGLALAVGAGLVPLAAGDDWMAPVWFGALPGVGKLGTALIFDAGVYLIVVGVLAGALFALFDDAARPAVDASSMRPDASGATS